MVLVRLEANIASTISQWIATVCKPITYVTVLEFLILFVDQAQHRNHLKKHLQTRAERSQSRKGLKHLKERPCLTEIIILS